MSLPSVLEFRPSETNSTPAVPGLDGSALEHEFEFNGLLVKGVLLESHGPSLALPDATPVNIERTEDGDFIVEEPSTGVFGHGSTPEGAFEDFMTAIIEYRTLLLKESPNISQRLRSHLAFIERLTGRDGR